MITGVFLYLPISFLFIRAAAREAKLSAIVIAAVAFAAAMPMIIHGYLIVFRGSRLFSI